MTPATAMVLAAGRGERLRPLTDALPKPLVEVAGKALIDHALDRLAQAGVVRAVVNVWHLGEMIEGHLAGRARPAVTISRESALLDTGGGVANALGEIGGDPFYVLASDALWRDGARPALERLAAAWNDATMDALLLLEPMERAVGFHGAGDFFLDDDGRLRRRGDAAHAPFAYMSVQITHPRLFADCPPGAFSNNLLWDRALAGGRLFGLAHDGGWCHVGTVADIARAERWLAAS
ncbi:MAG: nucleotidyltransferase family protein [Alphaproteobacteria bacterium]